MKNRIALIMLFLGFANIALSQTSIGFKNPENIQSLLSYRLPTWGYSTFIISTSGEVKNDDAKYSNDATNQRFHSNLNFDPIFVAYNESDNSITSLSARLSTNFRYRRSKTDPPASEDRKYRMFNNYLDLSGKLNRYYHKDAFFSGELGIHSRYEDTNTEYLTSSNTSNQVSRRNILDLRIGTGIGRVRDVTPMVRTLRFQERFAAIQNIPPFNDTQLQFLAHEIAKRSGYERVYDRSDKYFWKSLFEGIGVESTLSPYEIYYLSDIFKENVGVRLEGWDISGGVTWNYSNDELDRRLGGYGQIRWYKNLNLNHQIGVHVLGSLFNPLSDQTSIEYLGGINLILSYLWVISDRVLWRSDYLAYLDYTKYKEETRHPSSYKRESLMQGLNSDISYYIEDNLRFFIKANVALSRQEVFYSKYQTDRFALSFGVTFIVDRKLK